MTPVIIKPINVGRSINIVYILSEYTRNETYIVVVFFPAVIIAFFLSSQTTRTANGFAITSFRTARPNRFTVIVVTVAVVATDIEEAAAAVIVVNLNNDATILTTTKNNIVQSRHAKFLAWDVLPDIVPNHCAAVVYMDGYLTPVRYTSLRSLLSSIISAPFSSFFSLFYMLLGVDDGKQRHQVPPPLKFQNLIRQVRNHPWGLTQVKQKYFDGLPMTTLLRNLVRDRKDTAEHVEATLRWFHARADFREITPYYLNKYFAYDPNNAKYRELSLYFWETYTTYGGLWRDQPLWSYVLDHFNITPSIMTKEGTITKGGDLFRTGGRLGWGKHVYVP